MSFRSDISKLIFHHLVKEGYESSANNLIHECPYLVELKPVQPPYKLPRLMGASLVNLIENYFETKEKIIEQLELLESVVFREQDDLPNLAKILVENLKFKTPSTFQGQKETSDASVNTEWASKTPETCDASVNTESATPETCDVSVNTESISTPQTNDSSCNTECVRNKPETCDASVNTAVFNQEKNDPNQLSVENSKVPKETQDTNEIPHVIDSSEDVPNQFLSQNSPATLSTTQVFKHGCERSMNMNTAWVLNHVLQENSLHCSEQLEVSADTIDFSLVYDRLLEDRDLQEKIAENINKNKVILPNQGSSKRGSLASSQDLDTVIKAIIAETQTDPAFDDFLKDCIGSPDSAPQDWESTVSDNNRENQENCLIPDNLGARTIVKPSNIASSLFAVQNPDLLENSSVISGLNGLAFVTFSGQTTLVPTIISPMPSNAVPSLGERRKKKNPIVRTPVAIAPKPALTITIPAPDGNYPFPNAAGECEFFQQRMENQQQLLDCNIETINVETGPGPSATKPMKIKNRPLTKSKRRKVAITGNRVIQASPIPHSSENFITPGLAALVKISQEYGSSTSMDIQDQESVIEKELSKSPVVILNSHISNSTNFVSTPISTRSLSTRQLNSEELRALSNNPASISPIVHPKRSKIPRVLALRNAVAAPPDGEIFGTPKGKAKRRRKSSPAPLIETESHDMAMASVESLQQMALESGIHERIAPDSNLSHFGMNIITVEEPVIQQPLPVLATPQKEITKNVAVVNSLNSFGPWDGEIPRTPQIRLDLTRSGSPFQVLLTKGFRFLPAAESPNLPLPATPRIFEVNSSSIETPYTGVYQFPSVLSTPRLEALHQEISMESPDKSLSIAVVSPTQVAFDHPTPYFAPSGEQPQGPVNQNATSKHVPETEKSERRRRSSTVKDLLKLEESNGAIDAVETITAARQPITPYKDDQTLEHDLIGECHRLENDPSTELRSQQLVNLFGEDSRNRSEITKSAPSENAPLVAMSQSTLLITKQKTRKPKRTTSRKIDPGNESVNSVCARAQIHSFSPQAHRRKSQRLSNNSKHSSPREDEDLIQEVLALSRLNSSVGCRAQSSPSINRKRRSHSTSSVKIGLTDEVSSEKRSKRKHQSVVTSEDQVSAAIEVMPILTPSSSISSTVPFC